MKKTLAILTIISVITPYAEASPFAAMRIFMSRAKQMGLCAAGIAAASGLATQLPNNSQPVGDIKPGDYRCPQKLKFTVDPKENPGDQKYPGGYLFTGRREELNSKGFQVVDGEMIGSDQYGTQWKHLTIALPDANVHMKVGHDSLTADSYTAFLSCSDSAVSNETFFVSTPAHKRQKLQVQALYSNEQPHDETPKSSLTVYRYEIQEKESFLKRWFGWMKAW